uniref:Uncharacterized protein n=1 Tax=Branchiostoma floridae TaxID=7739 RepID=C3ZKU2_BRAFL|eukprot:XP_002590832.1 hypothetical protein BRAFLDRAFT_90032 [Branchiostoma floridae]
MFGLIMINAGFLLQFADKLYGYLKTDLNRCENRAHLTSSVEEDVTNDADSVDETPSAKDLDGPTDSAPNIPVGASASEPVPGQPDKTTEKEKGFCGFEPGFLMPKFANTEDASEGSETPSDLAGQDKPVETAEATAGGAASSVVGPVVPLARPARLTRRQLLLAQFQVRPILTLAPVPGTLNMYRIQPVWDGSAEAKSFFRDMLVAHRAVASTRL